jgi:hypothetical protein
MYHALSKIIAYLQCRTNASINPLDKFIRLYSGIVFFLNYLKKMFSSLVCFLIPFSSPLFPL